MNPGNTNPKQPHKPKQNLPKQDFTERLNQLIGRILGKKPNRPRPDLDSESKTANLTFIVIVLFSLLGLWALSGFYYVPDTQSALVFQSGKYQKTLQGPNAGFTLPYPFGSVIAVDTGVSDRLFIGKTSAIDTGYLAITKDLVGVSVNAEFSYQVVDPSKLFMNYLQEDNDVDTLMIQLVEQKMHTFIATNAANDLLTGNLIVLSNQLRDTANEELANYGIKLVKLNLSELKRYTVVANVATKSAVSTSEVATTDATNDHKATVESEALAMQLINEANDYQNEQLALAHANVAKFKQLLPQYKANPSVIAEQLYYQLLADVPVSRSKDYPLLQLSLPELLALAKSTTTVLSNNQNSDVKMNNDSTAISKDLRSVDRTVKRGRDLNRASVNEYGN